MTAGAAPTVGAPHNGNVRGIFDPEPFTWDYLEQGPEIWRVRIGRPA